MLRWFQSSKAKGLPGPSGPFSVGFVDYEWQPPRQSSEESRPSFMLARIYYPSLPVTRHEGTDAVDPQWRSRSHWIPSPAYFPGYGYYLKMPWYVASPLFRLVAGNIPIWAVEQAPVVPADRLPSLPLVVFSHGLAGIRTTYSTICTDLASHGYIVAVLEHRLLLWIRDKFARWLFSSELTLRQLFRRDGSASMSVTPQDESVPVLQYQHPPPENEAAHEFRALQLRHRCQEVKSVIDLFLAQTDDIPVNLWKVTSGREAGERDDLVENPLSLLRDRIDPRKVVMAGHSFGAATSILAAQEDERISGVLAFDPWLYPLPHNFTTTVMKRALPLLSINSETFHWPGNLEIAQAILQRNHQLAGQSPQSKHQSTRQEQLLSMQVTVRGSGHMDQSDFSVVIPNWLLRRYRSAELADPGLILQLNTRLARTFVEGVNGRVLGEDPLEPFSKLLWGGSTDEREWEQSGAEKGIRLDCCYK